MATIDGARVPLGALLRCTPETLPKIGRPCERMLWPDIAKGVSISLVVYWHTVEDSLALNEALIFLRMPLFFFIAGLFVRSTFFAGNERKFMAKTGRFAWLYLLWVVILSGLIRIPYNLVTGHAVLDEVPTAWSLLFDPPTTLWFIYLLMLAIGATMALRKVPIWLLIPLTLAGYMWSAWGGEFREIEFYERCLRLYPFFLLGLVSFELLDGVGGRLRDWGPAMLLAFCGLAYAVYFSPLAAFSPLTLALSLFGIFALTCTAQWLERRPIGRGLAWVGENSLYIYLMHRIFWAIGLAVLLADSSKSETIRTAVMSVVALAAIIGCAKLGPLMARQPKLAFLFDLPRLKPKTKIPA